MPEKPLSVLTYAAGASFAAAFLAWIFSPSIFRNSEGFSPFHKPGVVGLSNPANDCFINSVLQALASSETLRRFLADEHAIRSKSSGGKVGSLGSRQPQPSGSSKQQRLREGAVSDALRNILDRLVEVPNYKRTISARDFIVALEYSFDTRLSRHQQDAQELLHLVIERINDECEVIRKARDQSRPAPEDTIIENTLSNPQSTADAVEDFSSPGSAQGTINSDAKTLLPSSQAFPMEGVLESQVECQECHFKPKPSKSTFLVLTLSVLQQSSTSLDKCLDGLLKQEFIDDYKCDNCRLEYAIRVKTQQLAKAFSGQKETLEAEISSLQEALDNDPENPPTGVELLATAPTSRISRHTKLTRFPALLAVHLSRSIFDNSRYSTKNDAKVSFPEILLLGGFERIEYRLKSIITHRGGHHSGHYETFRRQVARPPLHPVQESAAASDGTHTDASSGIRPSTRDSQQTLDRRNGEVDAAQSTPLLKDQDRSPAKPSRSASTKSSHKHRDKRKEVDNKWWRISDDRSSDCRTKDVLAMQKEAYLLFYERVDTPPSRL